MISFLLSSFILLTQSAEAVPYAAEARVSDKNFYRIVIREEGISQIAQLILEGRSLGSLHFESILTPPDVAKASTVKFYRFAADETDALYRKIEEQSKALVLSTNSTDQLLPSTRPTSAPTDTQPILMSPVPLKISASDLASCTQQIDVYQLNLESCLKLIPWSAKFKNRTLDPYVPKLDAYVLLQDLAAPQDLKLREVYLSIAALYFLSPSATENRRFWIYSRAHQELPLAELIERFCEAWRETDSIEFSFKHLRFAELLKEEFLLTENLCK